MNKFLIIRSFFSVFLLVLLQPTNIYTKEMQTKSQDNLECYKVDNKKICLDSDVLKILKAAGVEPKAPKSEAKEITTKVESEKEKIESKPEEQDVRQEEKDVLTGVSVATFLSYSRIDAVDVSNASRGSVLSKADYGAEFKIMQIWKDYFTSEIILQAERRLYSTNSGRSFSQHGGGMFNFGAGMGFRALKNLELKLRILYGDEFYFRAPSVSSLAIDSTKALKFDIAVYYDVVSSKYASTGFGGGLRLLQGSYVDALAGTGYNTKTGYGYFGAFYMKHNFDYLHLEESFSYESIKKDSDLFSQTHMAAYLKISATLTF